MPEYYLAIDIGASSGRHILGCVDDGKITIEEIYRFPNGAVEKNGTKVWDYDSLLENCITGLSRCRELNKIPKSVSIDTWGVDFGLLDSENNLIGDTVSYRDLRTAGMDDVVDGIIPADELYGRTGIQKQIFNTIYQLTALKVKNPEILERAEHLLMMPDLLNFGLTGRMEQEYTNATTTQLVNINTGTWDLELIRMLGLPEKLFGKLSYPGETVGTLRKEIAERIGFDTMVVHCASHDTGSAYMAVPAVSDNSVFLSSGTWSLMGIESKKPFGGEEFLSYNFTNEGGYGNTYRVLKNIMGLWIIQSVKKEVGKYSFAELCTMAEELGDTEYRIDVNDNAFLSPASMIKAINEYCGTDDMPLDHMMCCIYQSLSDSYAATVKEISELTGYKFDCINIFGGGSKDDFLSLLTARKCKLPVYSGPTEATAIGNLIAQMIAAGVFATLADARKSIAESFNIKRIEC